MKFVKKELDPGIVVLEISGRFVMGRDCAQVDSEVQAHIARGEKRFILDLSAVDHMDSAAVGQIVKSYSSLKKSGGSLRLAGAKGMVEGVLKLTQVNRVIELLPTAQEAARDFPQSK
jgi:anti-sigma B factor antagonist